MKKLAFTAGKGGFFHNIKCCNLLPVINVKLLVVSTIK